jgi:hypothetical protein
MKKIKTMSHLLSILFHAACWVYLLIQIYYMFFNLDGFLTWLRPILGLTYNFSNLSFGQHIVIIALSCIPMSITILIYHQLAKLFRLYEQGYLFKIENIKLIKSIGICILANELIQFLYQPFMSFILTFYKPVGEHMIGISFGTSNLAMVVTGLVVLTASWIAEEAHELKLDTQLTF